MFIHTPTTEDNGGGVGGGRLSYSNILLSKFLVGPLRVTWTTAPSHGGWCRTGGTCQREPWCNIVTGRVPQANTEVNTCATPSPTAPPKLRSFYTSHRLCVRLHGEKSGPLSCRRGRSIPGITFRASGGSMPSPSDSSSVASASGSRGWSDSRRGMSGRGQGGGTAPAVPGPVPPGPRGHGAGLLLHQHGVHVLSTRATVLSLLGRLLCE